MSYAVPTIRGELRRHFRDHGWMVRPTRAVQEAHWQIVRAREELAHELGRPARLDVEDIRTVIGPVEPHPPRIEGLLNARLGWLT